MSLAPYWCRSRVRSTARVRGSGVAVPCPSVVSSCGSRGVLWSARGRGSPRGRTRRARRERLTAAGRPDPECWIRHEGRQAPIVDLPSDLLEPVSGQAARTVGARRHLTRADRLSGTRDDAEPTVSRRCHAGPSRHPGGPLGRSVTGRPETSTVTTSPGPASARSAAAAPGSGARAAPPRQWRRADRQDPVSKVSGLQWAALRAHDLAQRGTDPTQRARSSPGPSQARGTRPRAAAGPAHPAPGSTPRPAGLRGGPARSAGAFRASGPRPAATGGPTADLAAGRSGLAHPVRGRPGRRRVPQPAVRPIVRPGPRPVARWDRSWRGLRVQHAPFLTRLTPIRGPASAPGMSARRRPSPAAARHPRPGPPAGRGGPRRVPRRRRRG